MAGQGQVSSDANSDVEVWDPRTLVRSLDTREARLSNGFLRCHPERWFPGLSERWTPLITTLGCEVRLTEIKPTLQFADGGSVCYRGMLDQEPILVSLEEECANLIAQELVPRVKEGAHTALVVDYLVQRFIAVLGMCQTVSETAGVTFGGRCEADDVPVVAAVKLSCSLNSTPCSFLVCLGQELVDRMDKLWRRQVHSSTRQTAVDGPLRLEVAQLGVPPQMLSEYLTKGTVIDLEVRVSDGLTLRVGHKPFMPARMVEVGGRFACQTIQGVVSNVTIPEGTSRLSIELGALPIEASGLAELSQAGAVLVTDREVSNTVYLTINQERVGEAKLCVYQGRYAVEVV